MKVDSRKTRSVDKEFPKGLFVSIVLAGAITLSLIFAYLNVFGYAWIAPRIAFLLALIGMAAGSLLSVYFWPSWFLKSKWMDGKFSFLRLMLTALFLTLLILCTDFIYSTPNLSLDTKIGILTLIFGSGLSAIFLVLGFFLVIVRRRVASARAGLLGVVLEILILVTWQLMGAPWIP